LNRVAVITDIHGNLPALQASLDAIDRIGIDQIYCGGSSVTARTPTRCAH
jgi:predicted phosphodiesterase